MCYTQILMKENKLIIKKRDRCYYHCFMLLNYVSVSTRNSKKKKKKRGKIKNKGVVMLIVKDFFLGVARGQLPS